MKVIIELLGTENREDLLATSNYLRELASKEPKTMTEFDYQAAEAKVLEGRNGKTDLDKLADAVVEATKVKDEEKPKTVAEIVESERAKTRARRAAKPAPVEEPAPAKAEEPAPVEEPAKVEEPAPAEPKTDAASYTIDDCKSWAMKALNAKKRPIVQEAFESVGASSFPTLKEEMFNDFVAYISSRL